nr:MAG TPA: BssC/TutF protein [Caudoviricetes sp.]
MRQMHSCKECKFVKLDTVKLLIGMEKDKTV